MTDAIGLRLPFYRALTAVAAGVPALLSGMSDSLALSGAWSRAQFVEGRLVSAVEGVGDLERLTLGIDLRLKPEWKTYWRTPGDAGLAPVLDWSKSVNLAKAELQYPKPVRFQLFGLQTFGYEKQVVFPVLAKLAETGRTTDIRAKVDVLVCSDVCVPQVLNLAISVPQGRAVPGSEAHLIQRALSSVPDQGGASGLSIASVAADSSASGGSLTVQAVSDDGFRSPDVIAEVQPFAAFTAPQVTLSTDKKRAHFTLPLAQDLPPGTSLVGKPVTLTLIDGAKALETGRVIGEGTGEGTWDKAAALSLMLALALAGGFILNLMPCVLPVLSLKLMSLARAQELAAPQVRISFLATAAGIVVSLFALAVAMIAVKSAGVAVGWGVQFQMPAFIALMALVVTLFACNLWGLFEIVLPDSVSNWAVARSEDTSGLAGHFMTGVFATLLATPCSAPFVGTTVGFAFVSGPAVIVAIFLALGVGLASPYILVAAFPRLARALPRPGPWMTYLKWVLGLALALTAVWLLSVLQQQTGVATALATGALLAALVVALALPHYRPDFARGFFWTAAALAVAALAVPAVFNARENKHPVAMATDQIAWRDFNRNQIRSLIAQGKTIFVDVTADWCITCQANKKLVLYKSPVVERLRSGGVVAMQADWTSPDPAITAFLASFGRYGIPLNVVFGPGQPRGIVLPELLTASAVTSALDRVKTPRAASYDARLEP